MAYWKDNPPTHVLVAAYLMSGKQQHGRFVAEKNRPEDLFRAIAGAGGTTFGKLPQGYQIK